MVGNREDHPRDQVKGKIKRVGNSVAGDELREGELVQISAESASIVD